jgi:hypothetical protein
MAVSSQLARFTQDANSSVRQALQAISEAENALRYAIENGLAAELAALATDDAAVVTSPYTLTKAEVLQQAELLASLAFYLRGVALSTDATKTILGATPLTAAALVTRCRKLGI